MSKTLRFDDGTYAHELGNCDPAIDLDTHWLLLALMSKMVKHRDRTGDPEAAALVYQLGSIIERHEPKP